MAWSVRCTLLRFFAIVWILTITSISKANGEIEYVLQQCCAVGQTWGTNHTTCTGPPFPVPGIPAEDRIVCHTTIYICCIRIHRHLHCERGKQTAKAGHICSLPPTQGGEAFKDCCDGCSLGLAAGRKREMCNLSPNTAFGSPWDEAFTECCISTISSQGTSPFTGRNRSSRCDRDSPCSQICKEVGQNVQCSCYPGFRLASDQQSCEDLNECELGTHTCNPASETCVNSVGGFQCVEKYNQPQIPSNPVVGQCPQGFIRNQDKQTCDDIDECALGVCATGQVCTNTIGSYVCVQHSSGDDCPPGFRKNPAINRCIDIDECAEGIHACNPNSELCLNSHGSYHCQSKSSRSKDCPAGLKWSNTEARCEDVNECLEDLHNCEESTEMCRNTVGGYECDPRCPPGELYDAEQQICRRMDSCAINPSICKEDEICVNTGSSDYACIKRPILICPVGYKPETTASGIPERCVDVDECHEGLDSCDRASEQCVNYQGRYGCIPKERTQEQISCPSGFKYDPDRGKCKDVDECQLNLDHCNHTVELCVNTNGSYHCEAKSSQFINQCPPGYRLNVLTKNCEDINECEENRHKCFQDKEECINLPGAYQCQTAVPTECPTGYKYNDTNHACDDIDECSSGQHNCNMQSHHCFNVLGGFHCIPVPPCRSGYVFNMQKNSCTDVNECAEEIHTCNEETQSCENTAGSYRCISKGQSCPHGYRVIGLNRGCEDINECVENTHDCDLSQEDCVNTAGSFQCHSKPPIPRCGTGYKSEDGYCKDIDECEEGTDTCDRESEICHNSEGSFTCAPIAITHNTLEETTVTTTQPQRVFSRTRRPKYRVRPAFPKCSDGFTYSQISQSCIDIDECEEIRPCSRDQTCENTEGSFRCICQQGFTLDTVAKICRDVNECQLGLHSCSSSQRCDNTIGSYACVRTTSCGTGYTLNAHTDECEDDNECLLGSHNCGPGFVCRNTEGSFRCDRVSCQPGQKLLPDGTCQIVTCSIGMESDSLGNCRDINECTRGNVCRPTQRCINTFGSYRCQNLINCGPGFELNESGNQCVDIDECSQRTHECGSQQTCRNIPGGYSCDCPPGYSMNNDRQCEDIDECTRYRAQVCSITSECQNTQGSYVCNCKEGFTKADDGRNCIDVDECTQANICQQTCINVWGSYQCSCQQGYILGSDGRTCQDIDECAMWEGRGSLCIGVCVNEPGSYSCSCPEGYRLGTDKRTCQDIDECEEQNICKGENEVCLNTRGSFRCNIITCPLNYVRDREHRNVRGNHDTVMCRKKCKSIDIDCILNETQTITYQGLALPTIHFLPSPLILTTMRAVASGSSTRRFYTDYRILDGNEDHIFDILKGKGVGSLRLVKPLGGPQERTIKVLMVIQYGSQVRSAALSHHLAVLQIFVSKYDF